MQEAMIYFILNILFWTKNFFKDEKKFCKIPNIKIAKYFMWKTIIFQIIYAQLQSNFTFRRISVNFNPILFIFESFPFV